MARPPTYAFLDGFRFQPAPPAKGEQLFRALHAAIIGGSLPVGARLPASRDLAGTLGVSRQTVVQVYERLAAEGLVAGRGGAGTQVAALALPPAAAAPAGGAPSLPSSRARAVMALASRRDVGGSRPLRPGVPDVTAFPRAVWSRLEARYWRTGAPADLGYGTAAGVPALREAMAGFVGAYRGVPCRPDQIIVTPGSQAAILTAALTVADHGDAVAVESPGYGAGQQALLLAGLRLRPVPVDRQGLDLSALVAEEAPLRAILCTPAHHYPLGVPLSLERRLEVLRRAAACGALVIEDDYDSEFRYDGPPAPTLAALDDSRRRVLYVGTLSKLLAPGLRLGFLVVPDGLIDAAHAVRGAMDRQVSAPLQHVCADFIGGGHLAAHIRRMRPDYAERRQALVTALAEHFAPDLEVVGARMGLHACALMRDAAAESRFRDAAHRLGFGPARLSDFELPERVPRYWGLALGFADSTPTQLRRWVAALARAVA